MRRDVEHDHLVLAFFLALALWAAGVLSEAKSSHWGMATLDAIVFPVGVVDGFGAALRLW